MTNLAQAGPGKFRYLLIRQGLTGWIGKLGLLILPEWLLLLI